MRDRKYKISPGIYRWIVFLLLILGYVFVNFHRLCPAVVALDLMKDLNVDGRIVGLLASAYFYPYAFMQIPSGLLSDSWGPRKTITCFFILAGLASLALGFAQSVGAAIAARVLVGIGVSMYFVPIMKILTHWFTVSEFSFMTGLLIASGGVGALSAAAPLAYLSSAVGWRGSFIFMGGITLLTTVAIWAMVRNTPEELGYPAVGRGESSERKEQSSDTLPLWEAIQFVVTSLCFWPIAFWYFFTLGIFYSFGGLWGGPFLMEIYRLSKPEAGSVLSMLAVAIIIGSPIFSYLSDRVFHSRKKILILSSFFVLLLSLAITFFTDRFSVPLLYLWCFALGLFGCGVTVVGFSIAKESFPLRITGTAMGLVNVFPFLGAAISQPLVGFILDCHEMGTTGYSVEAYRHAFLLYIVLSLLALLSACFMVDTFPSSARNGSTMN